MAQKLLSYFRLLSLDIAFGGAVCCLALSKILVVEVPEPVLICLVLAIWAIYTFDHLVDAHKVKSPSMPRHQFHLRNTRWLKFFLAGAVFLGVYFAVRLPLITLHHGIGLSIAVAVYFLALTQIIGFIPKELIVGIVYAVGISLGPVSLSESLSWISIMCIVQLALLAVINLLILSLIEEWEDRHDGFRSWVIRFGARATRTHLNVLFVLAAASIVSLLVFSRQFDIVVFEISIALMTAILYWIFKQPYRFTQNQNYRLLSDLVFYFPGFVFFF